MERLCPRWMTRSGAVSPATYGSSNAALAMAAALVLGMGMDGAGVRGAEPGRAAGVARVCVTTPDIESLAKEIGGNRVSVVCFSKGEEDPHGIEIKPGHVRDLRAADLFIQVGLGIENAWLPDLARAAKNEAVRPGAKGHLNLGTQARLPEGIERGGVPGSFHEEGNPHYLLDPIEGLKAARAIRDKLGELRPEWAGEFGLRYDRFRQRLAVALVGEECADEDVEALALQVERARSAEEAARLREEHNLGGWLGAMLQYRGTEVVGDHDLWPYFARRYGLKILGYLEPSPGVPPTTKHLGALVEEMKAKKARIILSAPYFQQRHVQFVAKRTGARVAPMAHQTGGRRGAGDYLSMLEYNAGQVLKALREGP